MHAVGRVVALQRCELAGNFAGGPRWPDRLLFSEQDFLEDDCFS